MFLYAPLLCDCYVSIQIVNFHNHNFTISLFNIVSMTPIMSSNLLFSSVISYDGSVQCTAVTECGRVLRLEVNSLDNIYHKYTENERAMIDKPMDKPLLENASISPSGCTVAAGITMDSRNNPGNSKDREYSVGSRLVRKPELTVGKNV